MTFGIRHAVGIGSMNWFVPSQTSTSSLLCLHDKVSQHEGEVARAARCAAGKTVYCEWPLTPDPKTSAELVDLAVQKPVMQTHLRHPERRFAPGLRFHLERESSRRWLRRSCAAFGQDLHVTVSSFGKNAQARRFVERLPRKISWALPHHIFGAHLMDPLFLWIVGRPTRDLRPFLSTSGRKSQSSKRAREISTNVPGSIAAARHPSRAEPRSSPFISRAGSIMAPAVQIDIHG